MNRRALLTWLVLLFALVFAGGATSAERTTTGQQAAFDACWAFSATKTGTRSPNGASNIECLLITTDTYGVYTKNYATKTCWSVSGCFFERWWFKDFACPTDPTKFNGATRDCGESACAARNDEIHFPVPGDTPPPVVCKDGCTYAVEQDPGQVGPVCDNRTYPASNCHFVYTTAGAATYHAEDPTDPRFNATCGADSDNPRDPDADDDSDGTPNKDDSAPDDPNNGDDSGAGDESDNVSSGGGSCDSPPVSSGDGILTQIAFQTWKTRCAAEALVKMEGQKSSGGVVVSGGGLSSGDSAKLTAIQNNTAQTVNNTASTAVGIMALNSSLATGTAEQLGGEGPAGTEAGPASAEAAGHGGETEYGSEGLDQAGFGASQTCPEPPDVVVMGQTLHIDTTIFCDWMHLGGLLVLAIASVFCVRILGGTA